MNIWCLFLIATTLAVEISPKYVVEFHNAKISREKAGTYMSRYGRDVVLQRLEQADGVLEDGHFELLQGAGVYLCHVPYVNSTVSASEHLMETDMSQSDETIVRKALDILSESFSLQNCVFSRGFTGGYWTYAYCYGDKVIQYHENSELYITTGQRKPEHPNFVFILGRFEGSTFKKTKIENQLKEGSFAGLHPRDFSVNDDTINPFNQRNIHSTQKFLQHTINFGSICEETRERRSIDVIYKCDPLNNLGKIQIYDVNEIKTCQYQMVVSVPQLCALEEFQPTSLEEEVVEINCREVDAFDSGEILEATDSGKEYEEPQEGVSIEDFLSENGERPMFPRDLFPITNDYRISLSHYSLIPFGKGFFLAISRKPLETENVYFNQRHVLVYTKDIHSSEELVNEFGSMFQYAIGRKLLSPLVDVRTGYQNFLSWEDSFIMWFEMYDSLGYFNALIRVERKEEDFGILKLYFQIIPDPETMLDSDGDFVFIKLYDAPGGATNFEKYVPGAGSEFKVVTDVTEKPGIEEQERELKIKRDALATIQNVVKDKRERLKVVEDELSNGEGDLKHTKN